LCHEDDEGDCIEMTTDADLHDIVHSCGKETLKMSESLKPALQTEFDGPLSSCAPNVEVLLSMYTSVNSS